MQKEEEETIKYIKGLEKISSAKSSIINNQDNIISLLEEQSNLYQKVNLRLTSTCWSLLVLLILESLYILIMT